MNRSSILLLALAQVACAGLHADELKPAFKGKELIVAKPFELPAENYSVYFQGGQVVRSSGLTVWDLHCKLEFRQSPEQLVTISKGRYLLSGQKAFDDSCDRYGCVKTNEFALKTLQGREAVKLRCGQQYSYDSPGTYPEPLKADELQSTLGTYLKLQLAK